VTGPWVRLDLVAIRYVRPSDDLAIDDPLGGWCLEARTETGVAFRRLPPRGLGLARREERASVLPLLLSVGLMALGVMKLWELAAWLVIVAMRGG
jgi:hypothetical protein